MNGVPYCRFSPTANGPIHIGHLYMVLVNEQTAHKNGGFFYWRFDDNQDGQIRTHGIKKVQDFCESMRAEMDWMGVKVDKWTYQSHAEGLVRLLLKEWLGDGFVDVPLIPEYRPQVLTAVGFPYQYTPYLTAEKVVLDSIDGINLLIRGEELLTEFSLYCHFVTLFNLPKPEHIYLPKLKVGTANDEISKTVGNMQLQDLRNQGYSPHDIMNILKRSCLIDPSGPWFVSNIKKEPRIIWDS